MYVSRLHIRSDQLLGDYCDGTLFQNHPLFRDNNCRENSLSLQFIIYYDDVEVVNPLGSRRGKYKLGMHSEPTLIKFTFVCLIALFYYTLGNIRPKYRSTLRAIQLIAVVTYPLLKEYGFESVLQPFIKDMNELRKVSRLIYFKFYT